MISLENASLGISIFFTAVMIGRFLGAILLQWISSRKFFLYTTILAISGIIALIISRDLMLSRICIFITGFGLANLFPIIFATAVEKMPTYQRNFRIDDYGYRRRSFSTANYRFSQYFIWCPVWFLLLIAMLYILVISFSIP